MSKWLVSVSIAIMFAASGAQAAGDPQAGKTKSATCVACHGPDGNSPNPIWPSIAGQHPSYIKKQLHDFKSGARSNELMTPMSMPLSDQDIEDLAAYFAEQEQKPGKADPALVEAGQKMFRAGNANTQVAACMACHGPSGLGNPAAKYPRISGQHASYLAKALTDYRDGNRTNDENKMMRSVTARMTDQEIEAVASYMQGLH